MQNPLLVGRVIPEKAGVLCQIRNCAIDIGKADADYYYTKYYKALYKWFVYWFSNAWFILHAMCG
jgi:hypothetical protein